MSISAPIPVTAAAPDTPARRKFKLKLKRTVPPSTGRPPAAASATAQPAPAYPAQSAPGCNNDLLMCAPFSAAAAAVAGTTLGDAHIASITATSPTAAASTANEKLAKYQLKPESFPPAVSVGIRHLADSTQAVPEHEQRIRAQLRSIWDVVDQLDTPVLITAAQRAGIDLPAAISMLQDRILSRGSMNVAPDRAFDDDLDDLLLQATAALSSAEIAKQQAHAYCQRALADHQERCVVASKLQTVLHTLLEPNGPSLYQFLQTVRSHDRANLAQNIRTDVSQMFCEPGAPISVSVKSEPLTAPPLCVAKAKLSAQLALLHFDDDDASQESGEVVDNANGIDSSGSSHDSALRQVSLKNRNSMYYGVVHSLCTTAATQSQELRLCQHVEHFGR